MLLMVAGVQMFNHLVKYCYLDHIALRKTQQHIPADAKTFEYEPVLDWDDMQETGFWEKEARKIEKKWKDYIIITKMESYEAFRIMENFVDEVDDPKLKEDLIKILNRKSPFANFKMEVESSSYRQKWFDFKTKSYEEYIRQQLDLEDIENE